MTATAEKMLETAEFWEVFYEMLMQEWLTQEGHALRRRRSESKVAFELRKDILWADWCRRDFGHLSKEQLEAELAEAGLLLVPAEEELKLKAKAQREAPIYFDGKPSDDLVDVTETE